uniref:Zinc finger protein 575 n=1 Tax=Rousettus aegyptiacus TaxID=9407 RepID=A0A7J8CNP4_ROUAE|nr:zinc finger protein 575 [Rousettus aegyptiacus]
MLEREAESKAKATDPSPTTGKELVTKGAPHQGSPKKPRQSAPRADASAGPPSRPRRRPPPQRPHRCPDCDKAFSYPSKLATHRLAHGGTRPHPCPDCPKAFSYPCPHCPKAFSFPSKLAAHRLCHDPPTVPGGQATARHRCSSCSQVFGQRRLLLLHQRSHHQAENQGERE